MNSLEQELFDFICICDYYKGFGCYTNEHCIRMQIYAELIYNIGEWK